MLDHYFSRRFFIALFFIFFVSNSYSISSANSDSDALYDLANFQQNNTFMYSSGLPNKRHFTQLKILGVKTIVDLIPGDRQQEAAMVDELGLQYHNIAVDWEAPKLSDFEQYVAIMQSPQENQTNVLTHCKLNWRGAVFTYLYRVTQLNEPKSQAQKDLMNVWRPNQTWQKFIDEVEANY